MKDFKSYLSLVQEAKEQPEKEGDKSSSDKPEISEAIDYFDELLKNGKSHKSAFDKTVKDFSVDSHRLAKALVKKYKFDSDIFT